MNDVAGFSPSRGPLRDSYENPVFASNNQRSRRLLPAVADAATKPQQQQQQQHETGDIDPSHSHNNPFYEAQDGSRRPSSSNSLLRFVINENAEASTGAVPAASPAHPASAAIPRRAVRRTSSAAVLAARYLNQQRRASAALPRRTSSGLSPGSWHGEGPAEGPAAVSVLLATTATASSASPGFVHLCLLEPQ